MINSNPTQFAELNSLLHEMTLRQIDILGDNFVGAYLEGSFAVGDADMASDCDFLTVLDHEITPKQEAGLRALHNELPTRGGHWAGHLEGSYAYRDELKTLDGLGKEWLYVDHGSRDMEWSQHNNSAVVRWSLRECGVVLAGPAPRTLVDKVGAEILRAQATKDVRTALENILSWTSLENAWSQRYTVTTFCRILHTLDCGRVTSKKAALEWGRDHLDPKWSGLIRQVMADRAKFSSEPARDGAVEATLEFAKYAKGLAAGVTDSPSGAEQDK
jgi:hypothetical protein